MNRLAVARYGDAEVRQRNFVVIQQRSEMFEFLLHTYAKQLGSVMEVKKTCGKYEKN